MNSYFFFFCFLIAEKYARAFFLKFQTPVTPCSGELWSILVLRQEHSADLRSRLRHVSSAPTETDFETTPAVNVSEGLSQPTRRAICYGRVCTVLQLSTENVRIAAKFNYF